MGHSEDTQRLIHRLVLAVYQVSKSEWAKSRLVAKAMEGSEEYADYIAALAQFPEAVGLFAVSQDGRFIKLTEKGLQRATQTQAGTPSDTTANLSVPVTVHVNRNEMLKAA